MHICERYRETGYGDTIKTPKKYLKLCNFPSIQVPANQKVLWSATTVSISLQCCHGRPAITQWITLDVPRLRMATCCTVTAQGPPVLSRALSVDLITPSLSWPQMGRATAPSVTQCWPEQVVNLASWISLANNEYWVIFFWYLFALNCQMSLQIWNRRVNHHISKQLTIFSLSPVGPCPPDSVQVRLLPMQMEIQVIRFSWTEVNCTDIQYLLKLTGSLLGDSLALFELSSYWTSMTFFEIPLPCSSSYVATVESKNAIGTSDPSTPISGTTGRLKLLLTLLLERYAFLLIQYYQVTRVLIRSVLRFLSIVIQYNIFFVCFLFIWIILCSEN